MTGGGRAGADSLQPLREAMPHLGLDEEDLLIVPGAIPPKLRSTSLQASSYLPDFTSLVQRLLQLRRPGGSLSVALCGPREDVRARALAATQLAIGFTQHGLGTVVVDGDFSQPGLSGLLEDPHQEGLVDMVRFGRSCRALLHQPVTPGPQVLGTGSFPLQGPEPFEAEAWRGIVHRVALHGELTIYVGPVSSGQSENPLLAAVDQVVYVAGQDGGMEEDLERLRHSTARVAGVVAFHDSSRSRRTIPAPQSVAPASARPFEEAELQPEPEVAQGSEPEGTRTEGLGPSEALAASGEQMALPAPPESRPSVSQAAAPTPSVPPVAAPTSPVPPVATPQPAGGGAMPSAAEEGREAESERPLEPSFPAGTAAFPFKTDDAARPPEEAAELRRKLGLDEEEFSYSSAVRYSRVPLYLFLVLMATISGFVGWTLWKSHTGPGRSLPVSHQEPILPPPQTQSPARTEPSTTSPGEGGTISSRNEPGGGNETSPVKEPNDVAAQQAVPETQPPVETGTTPPAPDAGGGTASQAGSPVTSGASSPPASTTGETQTPGSEPAAEGGSAAEPVAPAGPIYAVHVASYRRIEQANQELANLRKHGYEGRAVRTDLGSKGIWFRVLVGSYPSKEAAEKAREVILKLPEYEFAQVRRVTVP